MAHLSKLQLIHNTQLNPLNIIHQRRIILIEQLKIQQEMAEAMIQRKRYTKLKVPPRQWYWQFEGIYYIHIFYDNKKLALKDGKSAVLVGSEIENIISTFGVLISAVEEGELDEALKDACMLKYSH